ncbi:MAG: hypothetical protein AUG74_11520 [Bacteroidetes bacterium 13_1_20CM_4_60_6]|nr:MAG: hypothetical protein AUG74_11520 [Bacteroidetes bacterium 13_1_20CM_4_60_6]
MLGSHGDGRPATNARLSYPEGMVVAPNGDIYFADVGNHRIRKVDIKTGVIDTIAGTGEKGFSGDGGPALKARLWSPGRVWVDHSGNVLIADIVNARVRRVDVKTGIIETIAGSGDLGDGGPARNAILSVPGDVVYSDGKVYVADYGTQRVRCIDLATGRISTVAGGGTRTDDDIPATEAELLLPEGIAVDARRKALYIADSIANRVWKVDLNTGILRTLAGRSKTGDPDGRGSAASERLNLPSAITVGPDGHVYIGDFGQRRVLVVDVDTGAIRTLYGLNPDNPLELAVTSLEGSPQGLFLLTHGSRELKLFDLERRVLLPLPLIDRLPPPASGDSQIIDVTARGQYVYLADALAHRVVRLDLRTRTVSVIAGSGVQGFSGDGGPADNASLFQPGGVAVSDDGRELFIADTKNHRIRRVRLLDNGVAK